MIANNAWNKTKKALKKKSNTYVMDKNTQACMDKVFQRWSWASFQRKLKADTYRWGLTHGDFHSGQLMYNNETGELIILDWEFSGIFGNPAIDLATWMFGLPHLWLDEIEEPLLAAYYKALIEGGVSMRDYPYTKFHEDYRIMGFA